MITLEDSSGEIEVDDQRLTKLFAAGFDLSAVRGDGWVEAKCSQCEAAVICGVACHEHGCCNGNAAFRHAEGMDPEQV